MLQCVHWVGRPASVVVAVVPCSAGTCRGGTQSLLALICKPGTLEKSLMLQTAHLQFAGHANQLDVVECNA